jgi:hypothetical protein
MGLLSGVWSVHSFELQLIEGVCCCGGCAVGRHHLRAWAVVAFWPNTVGSCSELQQ